MANNRLYLIHRPSGISYALGKRMGWGWYTHASVRPINEYYDVVIGWCSECNNPAQDDFVLSLESASDWGLTSDIYGGFGIMKQDNRKEVG